MPTVARMSISLEAPLLAQFEAYAAVNGFPSRSEAVKSLMRKALVVSEDHPLEDAVNQMRARGTKAEIVIGRDGRITGILTIENIAEMMMIHAARPGWRFNGKAG